MSYLTVNEYGCEEIHKNEPTRYNSLGFNDGSWSDQEALCYCGIDAEYTIELPSGTIEKLIGRELTWDDEPVEYK